jgi:hypothetical protein
MALSRYVLTSTVTLTAAQAVAVIAGEPGTGGAAGYGNTAVTPGTPSGSYANVPLTFLEGTAIVLDPAGALYAAIGSGNLRAYTQGTDDVGHAALSN